jgi:hypothetical protein
MGPGDDRVVNGQVVKDWAARRPRRGDSGLFHISME